MGAYKAWEEAVTRPINFQTPDERTVELLPWSDGDLTTMAEVSESDQEAALAYWQRLLPLRLRNLLRARSTIA